MWTFIAGLHVIEPRVIGKKENGSGEWVGVVFASSYHSISPSMVSLLLY